MVSMKKILAAVVVVVIGIAIFFAFSGTDAIANDIPAVGTLSSTMTVLFDDGTKEVLTRNDVLRLLNVAVFKGKNISRIDFTSSFAPEVGITYKSSLQAVLVHNGVVV